MSQICEMHGCNGTESNGLSRTFANKANCGKRYGHLFITSSIVLISSIKLISSSNSLKVLKSKISVGITLDIGN